MLNLQDVTLLLTYNYWANHRLLDRAALVTQEQFLAPSSHSFGSLRGTLVHTMDAEHGWRNAMSGKGFPPDLPAEDFPTVQDLQKRWIEEERAMWEFIGTLRDEDMESIIRYPIDNGVIRERILWQCLFHVVNHGMQHRSEAANLLTVYGRSPGDLEFTLFLNVQ